MAESFEFNVRVNDQYSRNLEKGETVLVGFDKELRQVNAELARMKINPGQFKELERARKELRGMQQAAGGEGGVLGSLKSIKTLAAVGLVGEAFSLVGDAIGGIIDLGGKAVGVIGSIAGKFIDATGGEERFRLASDQLFGPLSQSVQDYVDQVAKAGELTDDELKQMVLQLRTSGFEADELGQVLPAALDVGGFLGGGVANIQAATEALAHMRLTGEASKRQLVALGLSEKDVLEQLKSDTGLNVETLKKKMGEGKLDPKALLHAVYATIAKREGGELGTMAEKMGNTIEAKLKKLKDLPDQFFQQLVSSRGFDAFSTFLGDLVKELSPDSEFGKQVMTGLNEIGDAIADAFGTKGQGGIATIKKMILDVVEVTRDLIPIMRDFANIIIGIAKEVDQFYRNVKTRETRAPLEIAPPSFEGGESLIVNPSEGAKPPELSDAEQFQYGNFIAPPAPVSPLLPSSVGKGVGQGSVSQKAEVTVNIVGGTKDDADAISEAVTTSMPGAVGDTFDRMSTNYGAQ